MQMGLCPWIFLLHSRNIQRKRSWRAGTEHPALTCCCAGCKVLWVRAAPGCHWGEHHPPWGHSPYPVCSFWSLWIPQGHITGLTHLEEDSERDSTVGSKEDTVITVFFIITVWTVTMKGKKGFLVYGQYQYFFMENIVWSGVPWVKIQGKSCMKNGIWKWSLWPPC